MLKVRYLFAVSANKIEVINSRPNEKQDNISVLNDFFKSLTNDSNPATTDSGKLFDLTYLI